MAEIGVEANVLLEPVGRNTTAAIAAAAGWIVSRAADGIAAVFPADHHITDDSAFEAAIRATLAPASNGAIVTLGVPPTSPSTAYGYIRPSSGDGPVWPTVGFEEKADPVRAARLIAAGALWNSGIFVAAAGTICAEVRTFAPSVADAVDRALGDLTTSGETWLLGVAFADAPPIAFDRAVMEKTTLGAVLPVTFAWSDLGAWDAVLAASVTDADGNNLSHGARATDAHDVLVRAGSGIQVAVVGASRLAIVADGDAVLVCGLDQAQAVVSAGGAVGRATRLSTLVEAAEMFDVWLRTAALPLWATVGTDAATGAFREALTQDGQMVDPHRRARVQARQTFVFASAAAAGFAGPWLSVARAGFDTFRRDAMRADGLFASCLDLAGAQIDPTARLYEHGFVLLALAGLHKADPGRDAECEAVQLLERMQVFRHPAGGFRETGSNAFQANASMHLLEAALAWEEVGRDRAWGVLADGLVELALWRFIDPASGALSEFYDADWRRLTGTDGLIEPGHQFEWAWLLVRWGAARGDPRGVVAARRLFTVGRGAFDPVRGVVVNALWDDLTVRDPGARLWPQTEHLKAALILGDTAAALEAANGLAAYLDTPARGVWRERMRIDGGFVAEPSPATSLYHLFLAVRELAQHASKPC